MATTVNGLSIEDLRRRCDPGQFEFRSTEDLAPLEGVIGQDRAFRAVSLGIDIKCRGYHNTIDEGIELLTGKPAAEPQPEGTYPENTVNGAVQRRILELAEKAKEFSRRQDKPE